MKKLLLILLCLPLIGFGQTESKLIIVEDTFKRLEHMEAQTGLLMQIRDELQRAQYR